MNILKQRATLLDKREYGSEITKEECKQAETDGVVIMYWYSDDNVELRGAIDDEQWAWNWTTVYFSEDDLLASECDEDECPYFEAIKEKSKNVKVHRQKDNYAWVFETDIPHERFEIIEDWEIYSTGIVFDIKSLA